MTDVNDELVSIVETVRDRLTGVPFRRDGQVLVRVTAGGVIQNVHFGLDYGGEDDGPDDRSPVLCRFRCNSTLVWCPCPPGDGTSIRTGGTWT
jgi:hypothetical protein